MKRTLTCLLALALLFTCLWVFHLQADAASLFTGTCGDNLTWTLDDTGTLTISGTGPMDDYTVDEGSETSTIPWESAWPLIKTVVIKEGVESIGSWAFFNCQSLTSVTMGSSVESIGYGAFGSCAALESIVLGDGVRWIDDFVFSYCPKLKHITFPDNIAHIGDTLFYESYELIYNEYENAAYLGSSANPYLILAYAYDMEAKTFATHPDTRIIGDGAFGSFGNLTEVTLGKYVHTIGNYAFQYCFSLTQITIPASVTTIGIDVFDGCEQLTGIQVAADNPAYTNDASGVLFNKNKTELIQAPATISGTYTIPDSVKTIAPYAFNSCEKLTALTIPDSVETIGDYAFQYCGEVQMSIPSGVKSIGEGAFWDCDSMSSVTIPDGVTFLGKDAFLGCDSLTSVTIPGNITTVPEDAFKSCSKLANLVFADGVKHIGLSAFYECESLESVTFSNSIQSIGGYAFFGCTSLKNVTLSNSVESIGNSAFGYCSALESVSIGNGIQYVEMYAFSGCDNLKYTAYDTARYLGNSENPHLVLAELKSEDITTCTIPAGTKVITEEVFKECDQLASIWVKPENTAFSNDGKGVLFNKDKTKLIKAPCSVSGAYTIPATVTEIGYDAFNYCGTLDINIPASVKAIRSGAFNSKLENVYITDANAWCNIEYNSPDANPMYHARRLHILDKNGNAVEDLVLSSDVTAIPDYAFKYGYSLKTITIPDSVKSIGNSVFWDCYSLKSVSLGSGVTHIGDSAFDACHALTEIRVDAANPAYSNNAQGVLFNKDQSVLVRMPGGFYGAYTIPNHVTAIGNNAFYGCDGLTAITIGNNVKSIGQLALAYCDNLTQIKIPGSVNTISSYVFSSCEQLQTVTLEEGVEKIAIGAFYNCLALEKIVFPNSVKEIDSRVFEKCSNLKSVTIGSGTTYISLYAFDTCTSLAGIWVNENNPAYCSDAKGVLFNKEKTALVLVPVAISGEYTVPGTVCRIGDGAFDGCVGLTAITLSDGVEEIGSGAFNGCTGLSSIRIPDSVYYISGFAFSGCTGLTHVTIPASVQTISTSIFANCTNLKSVTLPAGVATINRGAFGDCKSLTDVYYAGTQEQWAEIRIDRMNDALNTATIHFEHAHTPASEPSATVEATCTAEGYVEYTCTCGTVYKETIEKLPHSFADGSCTVCGAPEAVPGDVDGNDAVDVDDAIYLLQYVLMPEMFPVEADADYDKNGMLNVDDAIYLLQHVLMPELFPL